MIALDQVFLSRDERDLALTGYSISKTGKDLFGNRMPFKFERISPNSPVIPVYYNALWWKLPIEKNVFNARLAFALPASLLPLLVFEIVMAFTKKKNLSFWTALIFSFSPWIFHVSRMALEVNLALPFLLGALLFQVNKRRLFSALFYILSFFSYQGFRPLIMILPFYLELYMYYIKTTELKKALKISSAFIFLMVSLVLISGLIEPNLGSRSSDEIIFFNTKKIEQEMKFMNDISTAPLFMKSLMAKKSLVIANHVTGNLFKGLDYSYLFHEGDYDPKYANGVYGQFPPLMALFLFLGISTLITRVGANHFLAGLAILGLLPSVINSYSLTFSIRSSLSALGLSFLMALGLDRGHAIIKKIEPTLKSMAVILVVVVLVLQMSSFYFKYFTIRYGLQAELFQESDRKVATYLESSKKKFTIVSPLPYQTLMAYVFLTPLKNGDLAALNKVLKNRYDNFTFKGNLFKSCDSYGYFVPEKASKTIMSENCVSGEKKPYL
jgi:hypothetical protein